jgi:hypothetical protein
VIALALVARASAVECDAPISTFELVGRATAAESALEALDSARFLAEATATRDGVPCVDGVLTPDQAAVVHRVFGLLARTDRRDDDVRIAFAAARAASPDLVFSEAVAPPGSPLREAYDAVPLSVGRSTPAPAPLDGEIWFDGRPSLERPAAWPTVLQRVDGAGAVVETAYLWPADPLPSWPVPVVEPPRERRGPRVGGLAVGGLGLAVAGLGAVTLLDAAGARSEFCVHSTCTESYWRSISWRFPVGGALVGVGAVGASAGAALSLGPRDIALSVRF